MKTEVAPDVLRSVKLFSDELLKRYLSIEQILLFGSQVKGTAKPDSDIDVLIIVQDENEWNAINTEGFQIKYDIDQRIHFNAATYEFNEQFIDKIRLEAVVIYDR
ncbi:nucleotidyltransferase family protein [Paenibacillus sp. FSL H3-0333]|uniref:nucleotidyltransferase family protein n=1 Tax=Paenibacillus sp. FSL H3-0333 TaxID=2921373 RepID=UPI0030FAC91B